MSGKRGRVLVTVLKVVKGVAVAGT